jgi:GntR family transcriptional regulator, transcriptional repressor for pyruvate dehydrogenase complex
MPPDPEGGRVAVASRGRDNGAPPTVAHFVTEQVLALIEREELGRGDRLPSVQALARRLSVAAPTVRESLRQLQALGVVDLRHGSGVYVRDARRRVLLANPYPGQLEARTILDLLEARLLIEPHLTALAAVLASDEELAELGVALDGARELLEDGPDELLHGLNMSFHRGVARLSRSSVLSQAIDSIIDVYAAEQMVILRLYDDRRRDHEEHLAIFEALRRRDAREASELMRLHIEGVRSVLSGRLDPPRQRKRASSR